MKSLAAVLLALLLMASFAPAIPDMRGVDAEEPQDGLEEDAIPRPTSVLDNMVVESIISKFQPPEAELALWYPGLQEGRGPLSVLEPGPIPMDSYERVIHKAEEAAQLGYTGAGVRVAVVDTGLDFAQPDLAGLQARVMDPASEYYLHPIVYDPTSLNDYLLDGVIDEGRSWFVNTSYEAQVWASGARLLVSYQDGSLNRTWDVTGMEGIEAGDTVRIGFHPDKKLELIYGRKVGVLLFASVDGGPWDRVAADLDDDDTFWDEKVAWINTDLANLNDTAELLYQDVDGDGVADLSGGMLYFIADGIRELPYASRQVEVVRLVWQTFLNDDTFDVWAEVGADPTANLVPQNGSLVALFGDFGPPGALGAHGTWVATALAGRGAVDRSGQGPNLTGMAPGVDLMAAGNLWGGDPLGLPWQFSLFFVAEGYDATVGTGDEARIASNSWGSAAFTGWSWSCRLVDYLGSVHSQNSTLYVFAAGNSGWGYGGLQCPGGAVSAVTVGASSNMLYRVDPWFAFDGGPNPSFGDIAPFSNRGPSALGSQYVDVMANGLFGYGAEPLNNYYAMTGEANGTAAWLLWAGTSLSTPNAAGILALIYEAYNATYGTFPDIATAKTLIMASADDMGNDPFNQGAGMANALRGVELASNVRGILPSTSEIRPGNFTGRSLEAFARVMHPGDFNSTSLSLTNVGTAGQSVTLAAASLRTNVTITHSFTVNSSAPSAEFILNATGLYQLNGTLITPLPGGAFNDSDVLRVSLFTELGSMRARAQYLLEIMDWTDVDGDGLFDGFDERNRMIIDWVLNGDQRGPNAKQFIHRPANRTNQGLYILLRPLDIGSLQEMNFTLQVHAMNREPFPWIDVLPASASLDPGVTKNFSINVTVPADASPGIYQASLLIRWEANVTTIPITIAVAATGVPLGMEATPTGGTYDNALVYGGAWKDDIGSGDFRYYFLDLREDVGHVPLAVNWTANGTWMEAYVLSPADDWFSARLSQRYGNYTLTVANFTGLPHGKGITIHANLSRGLHLVALRGSFVRGSSPADAFSFRAFRTNLTPPLIQGRGVPVDGLLNLTLDSEVDIPQLLIAPRGFSQILEVRQEPIATGEVKEYPFSMASGGYIRVATNGTPNLDIDIVLWYRHPILSWLIAGYSLRPGSEESFFSTLPPDGPYVLQVFAFSAPPGATFNLTLEFVQGRDLEAVAFPTSLSGGATGEVQVEYSMPHFKGVQRAVILAGPSSNPDMAMAFVEFEADLPPVFSNLQVPPGSIINDPSPILSLEMDDAPDPYYTGVDTASVRVEVDGLDFTGAAEINSTSVRLEVPVVLKDGQHNVSVVARDLQGNENVTTWSFTVDTVAPQLTVDPLPSITNSSTLRVTGTVEVGAILLVQGVPQSYNSDGSFSVEVSLVEGLQVVEVRALDQAGNEAVQTFDVVLDTQPPTLSVVEPVNGTVTSEGSIRVAGTTEVSARVTVNGLVVEVASDGSFEALVALEPGLNLLLVESRDPAGNVAQIVVSVRYDPPEELLREELERARDELNATRSDLESLRQELNATRQELNRTRQDLEEAERELRSLVDALTAVIVGALLVLAAGAGAVALVMYILFIRRGRLRPPEVG